MKKLLSEILSVLLVFSGFVYAQGYAGGGMMGYGGVGLFGLLIRGIFGLVYIAVAASIVSVIFWLTYKWIIKPK